MSSEHIFNVKIVGKIVLPDSSTMPISFTKNKKSAKQNKLAKLHRIQKKRCCYCNCKTILPNKEMGINPPNNMATIEHEFSKLSIFRYLLKNYERIKMSCFKCNQEKGKSQHKEVYSFYGYDKPIVDDNLLIDLLKNKF